MYEGIAMNNLVNKVQYDKMMAKDYLADTRQLSVEINAESGSPFSLNIEDIGNYTMSTHGVGQIRNHLKIPSGYAGMLMEKKPELLQSSINQLLPVNPGVRMIRTLNGSARAYLSNSYKIIDNYDIALTSAQTLAAMESEGHRFNIVSCDVTERKMYLKVVFPMTERDVVVGDAVQFGCIISNSEIGCGRTLVEPFVLRLVCDNGMIIPDAAMKRNHLGRKLKTDPGELVSQIYQSDTIEADSNLLMLELRDTIRSAVNEAEIDAHCNKMRRAANSEEVIRPVAAIKALTGDTLITNDEGETVLEQLLRGGDMSRWGMVNAITEASKVASDYDRATALETLGGAVMDFTESRWNKIAKCEVA